MPYSFKIDTKNNIVLFNATGAFTTDILLNCLKDVTSDPSFRSNVNHLVDLREVDSFPATTTDMHTRVNLDRNIEELLGQCKIALVSVSELVYGMLRMYEMLMDNALPEIQTFKNINDAIEWLDIEKEIIE